MKTLLKAEQLPKRKKRPRIPVTPNLQNLKAQEKAKKKAESDALTEEIFERIGDELMTVDEIVVTFDEEEEVSRAKVTARLGKLVNAGRIEKEAVKVDGKKRMAYRLPKAADAE